MTEKAAETERQLLFPDQTFISSNYFILALLVFLNSLGFFLIL